jgi:hypothetical protein
MVTGGKKPFALAARLAIPSNQEKVDTDKTRQINRR